RHVHAHATNDGGQLLDLDVQFGHFITLKPQGSGGGKGPLPGGKKRGTIGVGRLPFKRPPRRPPDPRGGQLEDGTLRPMRTAPRLLIPALLAVETVAACDCESMLARRRREGAPTTSEARPWDEPAPAPVRTAPTARPS